MVLTLVIAPGIGGNILLTTTAVANDVTAIQRAAACFQYYPTRKLAYLCRVRITTLLPTVFRAGLLNLGAPFAATDGIFFSKPAGGLFISLTVMSGGVVTGTAGLPIQGLGDNTVVDLGFQVEPEFQDVVAFCGQGLVGEAVGQFNTQPLGPQARVKPTAWPTTVLSPTLAVQSGAVTTAVSLTADFQLAALQRKNGG